MSRGVIQARKQNQLPGNDMSLVTDQTGGEWVNCVSDFWAGRWGQLKPQQWIDQIVVEIAASCPMLL